MVQGSQCVTVLLLRHTVMLSPIVSPACNTAAPWCCLPLLTDVCLSVRELVQRPPVRGLLAEGPQPSAHSVNDDDDGETVHSAGSGDIPTDRHALDQGPPEQKKCTTMGIEGRKGGVFFPVVQSTKYHGSFVPSAKFSISFWEAPSNPLFSYSKPLLIALNTADWPSTGVE